MQLCLLVRTTTQYGNTGNNRTNFSIIFVDKKQK